MLSHVRRARSWMFPPHLTPSTPTLGRPRVAGIWTGPRTRLLARQKWWFTLHSRNPDVWIRFRTHVAASKTLSVCVCVRQCLRENVCLRKNVCVWLCLWFGQGRETKTDRTKDRFRDKRERLTREGGKTGRLEGQTRG